MAVYIINWNYQNGNIKSGQVEKADYWFIIEYCRRKTGRSVKAAKLPIGKYGHDTVMELYKPIGLLLDSADLLDVSRMPQHCLHKRKWEPVEMYSLSVPGSSLSIVFVPKDGKGSLMEKDADLFARDTFIDPKSYKLFLAEMDFGYEAVQRFAEKQDIADFIVIGRLESDRNIPQARYAAIRKRYGV